MCQLPQGFFRELCWRQGMGPTILYAQSNFALGQPQSCSIADLSSKQGESSPTPRPFFSLLCLLLGWGLFTQQSFPYLCAKCLFCGQISAALPSLLQPGSLCRENPERNPSVGTFLAQLG